MTPDAPTNLTLENEELRQRLHEAEELIAAVRTGAIDALAIQGADGPRIFTLESAESGYRTLIEQMSEGAVLLDAAGLVLYCNAALARLLGRALPEVLGQYFEHLVPADYHAAWAALCAQGWERPARGELALRSGPAGEQRPFSVSINRLTSSTVPTLAVLLADVSARQQIATIRSVVARQNALLDHQSEELVRQQAARLAGEQAAAEARRMLEGIPQIAWTATAAGQPTYLNARWQELVGPPAGDNWDAWVAGCFHPGDLATALAAWQRSLASGQPLEVEVRFRNQAGEYRWMLGRGLPSRNEQGEIIEWIGTYTDIHERKLAEERETQAQRQLLENNAVLTRVNVDLDNFIYAASHDLRAPITNLDGLLQALGDELLPTALPAPATAMLGMMRDAVERFQRTIDQLTDVAQLQREPGGEVAPVAVAPLAADVRLDLAPLIEASGAGLDFDLAPGVAVRLLEKNLRSLLYNLLSNALKYRHPARPPRVRLRAQPAADASPGQVQLSVQDNGLGLDPAQQNRLFGLFERLHDHVEGSGMGLYLVKKMVENAGGRIAVESELGVGSTFTVFLPGNESAAK